MTELHLTKAHISYNQTDLYIYTAELTRGREQDVPRSAEIPILLLPEGVRGTLGGVAYHHLTLLDCQRRRGKISIVCANPLLYSLLQSPDDPEIRFYGHKEP